MISLSWSLTTAQLQPTSMPGVSVSVSAVCPLPSFLAVISLKADLVFSKWSKPGLCFWWTGCELEVSWSSPGGGLIFQSSAQNSGKVYSLDYQFIIKAVTQQKSDGRDAEGKARGKNVELPGWLLAPLSQHLLLFTKPGALWTLHFRGFLRRLHYVGVID